MSTQFYWVDFFFFLRPQVLKFGGRLTLKNQYFYMKISIQTKGGELIYVVDIQ